jgi:hypothetical protein
MIFCLRQLQEKCIEQDRPLYIVFVDFTKAFDTVGRTRLWQLLRKYGCPEKSTTMIEALHMGMMATVSVGGEISDSFDVTNGAKRGCVLAPTLLFIFLSAILDEVSQGMGDCIYIQSRESADSVEEIQKTVDAFSEASKKFGLKINIRKTEVLYKPNSARIQEEAITVEGKKLNSVSGFIYLGNTISSVDTLMLRYREGWPMHVHLSADYARDSGTNTMCLHMSKTRSIGQSCYPPYNTVLRLG